MDVLATAGHVDHGKSALVRALTGMEPDRWAEERRRGLTIDLGFAWTTLPSGRRLAVVDVPGHERFVGNMLAGVGSVPAALLIVAADDGWSAQTGEHVAVLDALGVRHGLVVVTKSDLADPAPVLADVRDRLAGRRWPTSPASASAPSPAGGCRSCTAPSSPCWPACRTRTSTRRCGCGSTAPSRSVARARWSPARSRPGPCARATASSWATARSACGACSPSASRSRRRRPRLGSH